MKKLYEILYKRAPRLLFIINKDKFMQLFWEEKRKHLFQFLERVNNFAAIQAQREEERKNETLSQLQEMKEKHKAEIAELEKQQMIERMEKESANNETFQNRI